MVSVRGEGEVSVSHVLPEAFAGTNLTEGGAREAAVGFLRERYGMALVKAEGEGEAEGDAKGEVKVKGEAKGEGEGGGQQCVQVREVAAEPHQRSARLDWTFTFACEGQVGTLTLTLSLTLNLNPNP